MKLKEVCQSTGLSRKTIRLYEEKGLIAPHRESRGDREYREYTPADVEMLRVVASLRRAWFTMDEIRRMQEDPAAIQEIFSQYREWLYAQKRQLDGLIAAAEKINEGRIVSVSQLSAEIGEEARKLPLPIMDVNPHFKRLDEMEAAEPRRLPKPSPEEMKQDADRRIYRQMAVSTSKNKWDDSGMMFRQLNETRAIGQEEGGPVQEREPEKLPWWLRLIQGVLMLAAVVSGIGCLVEAFGWRFPLRLWAIFVVTAGLRGALAYWQYRREQRRWLDRVDGKK